MTTISNVKFANKLMYETDILLHHIYFEIDTKVMGFGTSKNFLLFVPLNPLKITRT